MKKLTIFISLLLCFCMLIPAAPATAAEKPTKYEAEELAAEVSEPSVSPSSYSYNGYTTYLNSDCTFEWEVPNTTEGGNTMSGMQGMNTGTTYCYTAKIDGDDAYCDVTRINMDSGAKTVMSYYSSTSATSEGSNNSMGHANDLTVVGISGTNYMYVATLKTGTAITRLKIDGTKLIRTGYFELFTAAGTSVTASAIKHVKVSNGYVYFLIKRGNTFYNCKIPSTATGGSASNPTAITIYKIFTIDTRNAVVAKSNSSYGTYDVDDWTNQGFGYNKDEGVVYVPIWDSNTDNRNLIITYNIKDNVQDWLELTADQSKRVYPTRTSFMIQNTSYSLYEIESVGFRTGQGTTGDLKLYYNINCSTASKEGVYSCSYTTGKGDMTSLDTGAVLWTTKYNANGGSGTTSNTYHIRGISTKLRTNEFTRSGYSFAGWYLTRKSDGKWLYYDTDGTARWYAKGSQPNTSILALYKNEQSVSLLTASNGDVVTCYAQWVPDSTGTTTFYIQYDANGGTGSMSQTTVVYGTTTTIRENTFTREGYVFNGWNAYRRNKGQWCYKTVNESSISDKWLAVTEDTSAYIRKAYDDGTTTAKASSVDQDILTFYAVWSRVAGGVYPTSITKGSAFALGGTLESTGDMYSAVVKVKNSAGTVVATHTANPLGETYNLSGANADIDFSTLAVGSYTLEVQTGMLNTSTPFYTTVASTGFEVVDPAKLELTEAAAATGVYTLGDKYFTGFAEGNSIAAVKELFKYEITVTDANGATVEDSSVIGTGWTISCGDESRISVLMCDLNYDAVISSSDLLMLKAYISGSADMAELAIVAADTNTDSVANVTDSMALISMLTE